MLFFAAQGPAQDHTSYDSNSDVGKAACINDPIRLNDSVCLTHKSGQYHSVEEFACESSEQLQLSTSVNQVADNSTNSKVTSLYL